LKNTIAYILRFYLFWWLLFLAGKIFFLLINYTEISDWKNFHQYVINGFRLDISMISYLVIIPLIWSILFNAHQKIPNLILKLFLGILLFAVVVIYATDPYFYYYWGQKANVGVFAFIKKETAGFLSIEWKHYFGAFAFFFIFIFWGFKKIHLLSTHYRLKWWTVFLALPFIFIVLRGGLSNVPISVSSAYFSSNNLWNNAAVNPVWNALAEIVNDNTQKDFQLIPDEEATDLMAELDSKFEPIPYQSLIHFTPGKTNVVLIVLESFTGKLSGFLQDTPFSAMPNLDQLMREGIAFTNAYASSFRSDKGLTALISGFPSLSNQTLTDHATELSRQANIFDIFNQKGYHTSFYYGGNIEFANIKILFKDCDLLAEQSYFKSKDKNVWGVHDHITLDVFYQDLIKRKQPFLSGIFTLSSHEPFDVPNYKKHSEPLTNSVSYTDSCLGIFLHQLKESKLWENTLVVISADHGTTLPNRSALFLPENFHIPILFSGGVVKKDTIVETIVSQTDVAATLSFFLNQNNDFPFSQMMFRKNHRAFYTYYNGLAHLSDSCIQIFDIPQQKYIPGFECSKPIEKAYYQISQKDFFKIKN